MNRYSIGMLVLSLSVLGSALSVVYTAHVNRSLHIKLEQLQNTRNNLHVEWTQLLLEQSTLGSDVRVEKIAKEQLGMVIPLTNQIMVISP